jgi:TP901 family phage tail tape measure protein
MAKVLGFQIEIQGTQRAISTSEELRRAIADIGKELKKATDVDSIQKFEKELVDLKARQNEVNKEVRESVKARQAELTGVKQTTGAYAALSKELNDTRRQFKDLAAAEMGSSEEAQVLLRRITQLDSKLKDIDGSVGQFQRNVGNYSSALQGIGSALTGGLIGGGFVAFAELAKRGVQELFELNKDIADLQANVRKTTGLTEEQVQSLTESLKALDTRTSIEALLEISTVAGRLGVEGEKGVLEFTKAIDTLTVALGDDFSGGVEEVTDQVGKLSNVLFGATTDGEVLAENLLNLGNGLNVLAASGASSAQGITDFAGRIAALAKPLGVTNGEILGISATLEELGVNAERGGTATGRIFQALTQDSAKFAKEFGITEQVLKDAGFQAKSFTDLVNTDLVGALQLASNRAVTLSKNNVDLSKNLKAVGLTGAGELEVFLKLGSANERLAQNIETANGALVSQDSLLSEAKIKGENLAGAYERLVNEIREFFVSSDVQQFFIDLIEGARGATKGIKDLAQTMSPLFELIGDIGKATGAAEKETSAFASTLVVLSKAGEVAMVPFRTIFSLIKSIKGTFDGTITSIGQFYDTLTKPIQNLFGKQVKNVKTFIDIANKGKGEIFQFGRADEKKAEQSAEKVGTASGEGYTKGVVKEIKKSREQIQAEIDAQNLALEKAARETFRAQISAVGEELQNVSSQFNTQGFADTLISGLSPDQIISQTASIFKNVSTEIEKGFGDNIKIVDKFGDKLESTLNQNINAVAQDVVDFADKFKLEEVFGAALDIIGEFQAAKAEKEQEAFQQQIEQIDANILALEEKQQNVGRIRAKQIQLEIDAAKRQRAQAEAQAEEAQKKAAKREKSLAIIQATVQGALAVVRAIAAPPGFPLNLPSVITTGVLAAAQVATIAAQPLATGGVVGISGRRVTDGQNMPTRSNGDNVLATVRRGEVVLNQRQQSALGGAGTFRSIGVPGFADGGAIGAPNIAATVAGGSERVIELIEAVNGRIDRLQAYVVSDDVARDLAERDSLRVNASL